MKDTKSKVDAALREVSIKEGQVIAISEEIESNLEELRELLGCKPGQERKALDKLRDEIAEDEQAVVEILDEIEKLRSEHEPE